MRLKAAFFLAITAFGLGHAIAASAEAEAPAVDYTLYQGEQSLYQGEQSLAPGALDFPDSELSLRPADQISIGNSAFNLPALDPETADLWERIRVGFGMNELDSQLVKEHEAWYANRPEYVRRMAERSQRYLFHIVEEVEKRGMPTEIALLPMIESAYNPMAYSPSHASGIWQFIPSTGKNFGLSQNWLYDGRRDILAATDAALDYLQKLYNMFGSWELALASYNWGEGSVGRAIAKNQARGEPTDYLSLRMPPETRNYVPKLMAMKNIIMNPAAYGLTLNAIPNSPYFAKVKIKQQMDVAVAAKLAEVPVDEFVALNPAFNKPLVAGAGKPTLLLPVDKVNNFSLNLENYERPLSSWQTYTPKRGEKLAAIAQRFGLSLARLKEINGIGAHNKKLVAQTLLVPVAKSGNVPTLAAHIPDNEPVRETLSADRKTTHIVARGDTVLNIAKRYGMTVVQLKAQNRLKTNNLARGQKLTVLAAATKPEKSILAAATNPGKSALAQARTTAGKSDRSKPLPVAKAPAKDRHAHYVVQRGDTVFSIARRFKVAVNDLQRWNNLPANFSLQPGNKLMVASRKG